MNFEEKKFTLKGWVVWSICALFFLYDFLMRTVVGTFQHPIMYDLELSSVKFSLLSSTVFCLTYAILQIPAGMVVDNLGLKKTLLVSTSICFVSLIGFSFANSFLAAITFRFLSAIGSSCGFICLAVAVMEWMPQSKRATLMGISQFIGTMGPVLAAGPLEYYANHTALGWRPFFIGLSILGAIIFILALLAVQNNREQIGAYTIIHKKDKPKDRLRTLFKSYTPWLIACFSGSIYFAIEYLSENEGRTFIALKGFSAQFASYLLSIAWISFAFGAPLLGFLSDSFQRRKPFMIFAAFTCALSISGIIFTNNKYLLIISFILLGISGSSQTIGFTIIVEYFQKKYTGLGISINNAALGLFASANAPLLALIIDNTRNLNTPQLSDYTVAFTIMLTTVSIFTAVPLFFIQETYAKSKIDFTIINN